MFLTIWQLSLKRHFSHKSCEIFQVSQEPPDNNTTKKTRSVYNNESLHEDQVIMKFTWKNLSNNHSNGIKEINGDIINENYYPHERNLGTVFEKVVKNFLLRFAEICWGLLRFTEFYWALLRFAENCWGLLNITEHCWDLLRIVEDCWALLSFTEHYWVILSSADFY